VPWQEIAAEALEGERQAAWHHCQTLANDPCILDRFSETLRRGGVVGEDRNAKLLYLALTSRFLDRPVSIAVKGPSAGGKSFVLQKALTFFPEAAYHALTGLSEKALAYGEEPLEHRFLVIFEAVGLQGEFGSYLMRTLLSEGRLVYEVTEKAGEEYRTRRIEREGPTGLIVTTTAVSLHPENETRLLSLTVKDTAEQTRAIMVASARDGGDTEVDASPWQALQIWLTGGRHEVVIPYAEALARRIPAVAVRLRRDFTTLLNLIRAHSILHQANRERDSRGRIIAALADYTVVRDLVSDLFSDGLSLTVSETIRETVETVIQLDRDRSSGVAQIDVAKALKLDESTASRRIKAACQRGYIMNLEDRNGRPARLVQGDPLPDTIEVLPKAEDLSSEPLQACSRDRGDSTPPPPRVAEQEERRLPQQEKGPVAAIAPQARPALVAHQEEQP
jgi:hypothetical protein